MVLGLALSVLIGVSLGLLGGGGSILTVPILIYAIGMEPKVAIATSLIVVGSTSLTATIAHARAGRVRKRTGAIFGVAGMIGAFGGGRLAHYLPVRVLLLGFCAMMLAAAIAMLRKREESKPSVLVDVPVARVLVRGIVVGMIAGLVGAGGGFLVVPALALLGGLPMDVAVGTSLLVIAMQSYAGFFGYLGHVDIPWGTALMVTTAAIGGSLIGARFAGRVPNQQLRRWFGWFVGMMAIYLFSKQLPSSVVESEGYQLLVTRAWPLWAGIGVVALGALVLRYVRAEQMSKGTVHE